jgi:hemolysin activation/secretion protein
VRQRLLLDLGKPLRRERLQERFQLLLADPMIERLDGVLRPGAWPGESTLDLRVSRSKPYGASVAFDNHRPPSTGAETARLGAWAKNLTGHGDIAAVEFDLSEGAEEFKGGFFLPLDAHDTRIGASYQAANATVVEESLEALDIESDFSSLDLHLNRPFIKTLSRRFSLGLQFSWRESQTFLLHQPMSFSAGVGSDGKAKVSVLRLIQEYSERRPDWVLSARSTFSLGLEAFDATINEGLPDGRFLSWIGQLQMAHRLADRGTQLIMRADLQLADSALLPLERFALGGARTLRGYRENQWVRDEGFAAGLELRYPVLGDPRMEQNQSLQLAPFLDVGSAWNRAQRSQADVYSSLGLGVLWAWRNLQAALYWAAPLKSVASYPDRDLQDAGFSFRFAAQFD